jgi:hypothetical protein
MTAPAMPHVMVGEHSQILAAFGLSQGKSPRGNRGIVGKHVPRPKVAAGVPGGIAEHMTVQKEKPCAQVEGDERHHQSPAKPENALSIRELIHALSINGGQVQGNRVCHRLLAGHMRMMKFLQSSSKDLTMTLNNPEKPKRSATDDFELAVAISPTADSGKVTARKAGGITDLDLDVSPGSVSKTLALRNMAKALNIALKADYLETELDQVYKGARVYKGQVQVMHREYIGLGDGFFAQIGRTVKSFRLTFRGPDAGSPEGEAWIKEHGNGSLSGVLNLLGRKLNLIQEYEDKVPIYVEQTLDRLEAQRIIANWHRDEWTISTTAIGLDVILEPIVEAEA